MRNSMAFEFFKILQRLMQKMEGFTMLNNFCFSGITFFKGLESGFKRYWYVFPANIELILVLQETDLSFLRILGFIIFQLDWIIVVDGVKMLKISQLIKLFRWLHHCLRFSALSLR